MHCPDIPLAEREGACAELLWIVAEVCTLPLVHP